MKTQLKVIVLVSLLAALPGIASATHILDIVGSADCEGWSAEVHMTWGSASEATFGYSVILEDENGLEVERVEENSTLINPGPGEQYFTVSGVWGSELCGEYTVSGSFSMSAVGSGGWIDNSSGSFVSQVTCICEEDACHFTPGYWKNHPEDWPVASLSLGGVEYSQDEAMAVLDTPVRGDATIILAYHLIAAKLNVANGADSSINDTIMAADDLLADVGGIGSKPSGSDRAMALTLKSSMADYNEMGCDGEDEMEGPSKRFEPSDESKSWGSVKSLYR